MTSHAAIVHCALQESKRLSHYETNYYRRMSDPHERLRGARLAAGFETSRAAAAAMGISEFTYNAHENGTRGIKADSAQRYARKFKVPEEWLLYGKGPGPGGDASGFITATELEPIILSALLDVPPGTSQRDMVPIMAQAVRDHLVASGRNVTEMSGRSPPPPHTIRALGQGKKLI